tara:strand:+ start:293 stop:694 length:402 start_codon:yes stop_codon:yes gene_type:complete
MSKEISIVKLMDGSTVVGRIEYGTDCIEIEHPIELVSNVTPVGAHIGEQISLRPWMAISDETIFVVERMQIITIGLLGEDFEGGYERMVETIYNQPTHWSGDLYKANEEDNIDDLDIDTLTELADAVLKKQIH